MMKRILACGGFLPAILMLLLPMTAHAAFDKNTVMSDAIFNASTSMSAADIDSWINAKYGSTSCISSLHKFKAPEPIAFNPGSGFSSTGSFNYGAAGFWYGPDVTAGTVIYNAAHVYGLNPRVILATLEKEENLVSGASGCSTLRYTSALGYDCPDVRTSHNYSGHELYSINGVKTTSVTGTCVARQQEAGFSQQVIYATWQFKYNQQRALGNANWDVEVSDFPHSGDNWDNSSDKTFCYSGYMTPGDRALGGTGSGCTTATTWSGRYTVDSTSVTMQTGATASLYDYTPHISGNQSFYNTYVGWFGSTQASPVVIKTASGSTTTESGGQVTLQFSLVSQPTSNVTIPVSVSDSSEASLNKSSLVITTSNWNSSASNTVIVTGLDDGSPDGDISYTVLTGQPSSSDPSYGNLSANDVPDIRLTNIDNEPDVPIVGKWNGGKADVISLKRGGVFLLEYANNGVTAASFGWGHWDDQLLLGDWNGDGKTDIGIKRGNSYVLETSNGKLYASFTFGVSSDTALVGDWDGNHKDTIAIKRAISGGVARYYFDNSFRGTTSFKFDYGLASDTTLVGDWDGNGTDNIAVHRGSRYYLNFDDRGTTNRKFDYGLASDTTLVGDWDGNGTDNIAVHRGSRYYLNFDDRGTTNRKFDYGR